MARCSGVEVALLTCALLACLPMGTFAERGGLRKHLKKGEVIDVEKSGGKSESFTVVDHDSGSDSASHEYTKGEVLKIKGKHYQVTHAEKAKPKVKFTPGKVDLAKMNEMALKKAKRMLEKAEKSMVAEPHDTGRATSKVMEMLDGFLKDLRKKQSAEKKAKRAGKVASEVVATEPKKAAIKMLTGVAHDKAKEMLAKAFSGVSSKGAGKVQPKCVIKSCRSMVLHLVDSKTKLAGEKMQKAATVRAQKLKGPLAKLRLKQQALARKLKDKKKIQSNDEKALKKVKESIAKNMKKAKEIKRKLTVERKNSGKALMLATSLVSVRNATARASLKMKSASKKAKRSTGALKQAQDDAKLVRDELAAANERLKIAMYTAKDEKRKGDLLKMPSGMADDEGNQTKKFLEMVFCPPGSKRKGTKCITTVFCPKGATRRGDSCIANVQCPSGSKLRKKDQTCHAERVTCPAPSILNGTTCQWPPACKNPDEVYNGTHCNKKMQCPPGTDNVHDMFCIMPVRCPNGTKPHDGICLNTKVRRVKCPKGTIERAGQCYIAKSKCPKGTKNVANLCYAKEVRCPPGSEKKRGECVDKKITCPEGTHVSKDSKTGDRVCVMDRCPPGTKAVGHKCIGKVVCPAGSVPSVSQEGLCLKTAICPENAKRVKDKCVMEPACANPKAILHNGSCFMPPVCPPKTIMVDGNCVYNMLSPQEDFGEGAESRSRPMPSPAEVHTMDAAGRT